MKMPVPVYIYRNLKSNCWSVKRKGLVIAHCRAIAVSHGDFKVGRKGTERVRRTKQKMVHAYVVAHTVDAVWGLTKTDNWVDDNPLSLAIQLNLKHFAMSKKIPPNEATYDPYKHDTFVDVAEPLHRVYFADNIVLSPDSKVYYS